jgi:hypothetical protein
MKGFSFNYIQLLQSCRALVAVNPRLAPGVIQIWLFQSRRMNYIIELLDIYKYRRSIVWESIRTGQVQLFRQALFPEHRIK